MEANNNVEQIVKSIYEDIISVVTSVKCEFSSEKTLVFQWAWRLAKSGHVDENTIDFERSLFEEFSDGTFLDLFAIIAGNKVGFEFKFPQSSMNGNSNQTQTRIKCINDIKRLTYLVKEGKLDIGFFVMFTNERPYTEERNKSKAVDFRTYNNVEYKKGTEMPKDSLSKESVTLVNDIKFQWIKLGPYYALSPIPIKVV